MTDNNATALPTCPECGAEGSLTYSEEVTSLYTVVAVNSDTISVDYPDIDWSLPSGKKVFCGECDFSADFDDPPAKYVNVRYL